MKNLILLSVFIFATIQLFSQNNRYWVNGSGNWSDTEHWSLSSGGEAGANIPTKANNVFIDANSSLSVSDAVIIKNSTKVNGFNISTPALLKGKGSIEIYGSVKISDKANLSKYKGDITFSSSSNQNITISTDLNSNIIFNGKNGSWDLTSDISTRKNIYLEKGYLNTQNKNIECSSFIGSGNENRGLNLGNSEITVSTWDMSNDDKLDFVVGNSQIIVSKDFQSNFKSGDLVYNSVAPAASKGGVDEADIDLTPTDATCPYNTYDAGHAPLTHYSDGSVFVSVTAGAGTYTIELTQWDGSSFVNVAGPVSGNDITFPDLESGGYLVIVTNGGGSTPKYVVVGPTDLVVDFLINSNVICPDGDDLSLTASPSGGSGTYTTYKWSSQINGYTDPGTATTPAELLFGDNYFVTVTDDNTCQADTNFYYLQISNGLNDYLVADGRPETIVLSGITTTASCSGGANNGSITVGSVTGGTGAPYEYAAILAAGSPAPADWGAASTIANLPAGDYHVWVRDGNNCEQENSGTINVAETPAPTVTALSDDKMCESDSYTFSGVVVTNEASISWASDDGKGTWANETTANPTFTPHADHYGNTVDLTITVNGNGNCSLVQETMTLTVNNNPSADLSINATDICENANLNLDGNPAGGSGTYTTHLWTGTGAIHLDNTGIETPVFNSTSFGSFGLTYKVTDDNGCSATDNMTVDVQDGPSVNAGLNDATCENNAYTVPVNHAAATNATLAWTENGTGSITSGATTLTPTYTPGVGETGNINLTLTATGLGACVTTDVVDAMSLAINPLPIPTITGDNSACLNTAKTYSTEAGMSGYTWTVADGTIDSGQGTNSISITWTTQVAPKVTVTYINGNSCSAAAPTELNVTVNDNPTPDLSVNATTACQDTDLALDGNPLGGSGTYSTHLWTGTGATHLDNSGSETPTFNCPTPASYGLTYTVTDDNGCQGSDNMSMTVNTGPSVDAGADDASCQDSPYTVAVSHASGNDGSFAWSEDGTGSFTSGATTLTPTYTPGAGETGDVTFTLTVTGAGVCAGSSVFDEMILTLNALPVPTITGDINLCLNTSATYTTEAGMTGYNWSVVAGSITSGAGTNEIIVLWTSTVTPSVSISYTDANSCGAAAPTVQNITVHNSPSPDLSINSDQACQNSNLLLDGNPSGGSNVFITHKWTDAGAAFLDDTNIETPTFNCPTPADYDLTYTVIDNNGCEGSDNITITVNPGPTADAGIDDATCEDVAYTLPASQATATNGTIAWTEDGTGSITSGATTITPTYTPGAGEIGDVNLTLTVTGTGACIASTAVDNMILTINPLPTPTITGDNSACLNTSKTYSTEAGMTGYVWTIADGTIDSGQGTDAISVTWTSQVAPKITVNYNNANSCSAVAPTELNVTVNDNPTADLSGNATTVCENNDLILDGNPLGGSGTYTTHLWSDAGITYLDDINIQGPTFNSNTPGNYNLTYTVTDDNGCEDSDNMTITVTNGPTAFAGIDTSLCYNTPDYTISDAVATNHSAISWINSTTGDGTGFDNPTSQNPVYTLSDDDRTAGTVTLTMTVSSATCSDIVDDMVINLTPELVASVGGVSPYLIDVTTTEISVSFSLNHQDISQLGFFLVAPDGVTEMELYRFNLVDDGCNPLLAAIPNTIDSLIFSLNGTTAGTFNLCNFDGAASITGEFDPKDSWNIIDGLDPAEGGWSIRIDDPNSGASGTLTKANIVFLDKDLNGDDKLIVFSSGDINYPITDNTSTTYTVPIGLRTNCYGACDARAIVSVVGGTAPYISYLWSDGQTGDEVDLCGGSHTVTVTDTKGCTSVGSVTVLEPDPIVITIDSIRNVYCKGDSTGYIEVSGSVGSGGPFTYEWRSGDPTFYETTNIIDSLPVGIYTVTVLDKNSCGQDSIITITEPLTPISITNIIIDSTDCTVDNGRIKVSAIGGTPFTVNDPYVYLWDINGSIGDTLINIGVDNYLVSITDSLGCSLDTTITMVDKGDLVISGFTMLQEISCNGTCDGEVQVDFTGGSGNFNYSWTGGGLTGANVSLPNVCGDSTYTILITDVTTTCSTTDLYKIIQPDSVKMSIISQTDVLCKGDSTGVAEITGTGGVGLSAADYTYNWHNGLGLTYSTTEKANNLPYGWTYIDIADANLCPVNDSIFIDEPLAVLTATKDSTKTQCGVSTGSVVITPAGGTPSAGASPYTYLWSDVAGSTDSLVNNLPTGVYNVTVTDFNGCELYESVTVIDDSNIDVVLDSIDNVLCAGGNNGAAFITVTNGTDPLDYLWTNGEITEDAIMLKAGTNYVTVTDANLCSRVVEAVITQPDSLKATQNIIDEPLCFESATGTAAVTPTGGTEPYSYLWPDGQTDSLAINLLAGEYIVTITDANGCDTTQTIVLTDPLPITFDFKLTETDCGLSIGELNVTNIAGGTGTYNTDWASPEWDSYPTADSIGTDTIRNLSVANYVAIITDGNGCIVRDSINMKDNSNMSIVLDAIVNITCNGASTGSILVHGTDGTEPYSYLWDTSDSDSLLNDVTAGIYSVIVKDANQCRRDTSFTITEPSAIVNKWVFTDSIVCSGKDSVSFYANISGGVAPYTYLWENSLGLVVATDSNLVNVKTDKYYLTVVDNSNCTYLDSINIFEPDAIALSTITTQTTCPDSVGTATVTATGGVAPYTYFWYQESNPAQIIDGQNTNSASKLWVDIFIVQVTDSLGCVASDTVIIEDDSNLDFTIEILNHVTCIEKCDASAEIKNPTGGVTDGSAFGYSVEWGNGETTPIATTLCLGTTQVYLIDALGCKAVKPVVISDEEALAVTIQKLNDISQGTDNCNGFAKADVYGGIEPYTYAWSKDSDPTIIGTTNSIFDLCEGWYHVTITDGSAIPVCELIDSVFIADDSLRYDTVLLQQVLCNGDSTGLITLQGQGGYPGGYNYEWANNDWSSYPASDSTGATISNLAVGRYYFTITDNGASLINDSIDITQPDLFVLDFAIDETNCYDSTGRITVNEAGSTGGTAPFTYEWANDNWSSNPLPDSTGLSISNLHVGDYTAFITDANGCIVIDTVEMKDNSSFAINPAIYTPVMCFGLSTGSIYSNPSNAIGDLTFTWETGQTTDTIYNLVADYYTVTVVDGDGCVRTESVELTQPDSITFVLKDTVQNDCYTFCEGSVAVDSIFGGNNSEATDIWNYYIFQEDGSILQEGTDSIFRDLCPSNYNIRVEDKLGCFSELYPFNFLSKSPEMIATFGIVDTATCNNFTDDGEMWVEIEMGHIPSDVITYGYMWDENPALSNDTLENVLASSHFVKVTDNLGCDSTFYSNMPSKYSSKIDTAYILSSGFQNDFLCPSITDTLIAFAQVTSTVQWSSSSPSSIIGDNVSDMIIVVSDSSQTYTAESRYFYTNDKFCFDTRTVNVYRYSIDSLIAISDANDNKIHLGNELVLSVDDPEVLPDTITNINIVHNYLWRASTDNIEWLTDQDDYTATAKPTDNTMFVVSDSILITSNLYSNRTCLLYDTLNIEVLPDFDPPKGFSPNGDGMYDEWELPGINGYDNVAVQIYDRWGGIVWEENGDYDANKWKGENSKGKQLPSGTYYFLITYSNEGEGTKTLTGPITIIR